MTVVVETVSAAPAASASVPKKREYVKGFVGSMKVKAEGMARFAKTYGVVRRGVEAVEGVAMPLVSKYSGLVSAYESAVVGYCDEVVGDGVERVQPRVAALLAATERVHAQVQPHVNRLFAAKQHVESQVDLAKGYVDSKVFQPTKAFYAVALESWLRLDKDADGHVGLNDLVGSMRQSLGSQWDDKLTRQARLFAEAARLEWLQLDVDGDGRVSTEDLQLAMKQKLDSVIRTAYVAGKGLIEPAESFYQHAVDVWLRVDTERNGNISLQDFVGAMKVRLGNMWNDSLLQPAEAFYNVARVEWNKLAVDGSGQVLPLHELRANFSALLKERVVEPFVLATERAVSRFLPPASVAVPDTTAMISRLRLLPAAVAERIATHVAAEARQLSLYAKSSAARLSKSELARYAISSVNSVSVRVVPVLTSARNDVNVRVVAPAMVMFNNAVLNSRAYYAQNASKFTRAELQQMLRERLETLRALRLAQVQTVVELSFVQGKVVLKQYACSLVNLCMETKSRSTQALNSTQESVLAALESRLFVPTSALLQASQGRIVAALPAHLSNKSLSDISHSFYNSASQRAFVFANFVASTSIGNIVLSRLNQEQVQQIVQQLSTLALKYKAKINERWLKKQVNLFKVNAYALLCSALVEAKQRLIDNEFTYVLSKINQRFGFIMDHIAWKLKYQASVVVKKAVKSLKTLYDM